MEVFNKRRLPRFRKGKIRKSSKININFSRQHWLNLPTQEAFEIINKEKFLIDSTLG